MKEMGWAGGVCVENESKGYQRVRRVFIGLSGVARLRCYPAPETAL